MSGADANYWQGRCWAAERDYNAAYARANENADIANRWQRSSDQWEARALKAERLLTERDRELAALKTKQTASQDALAKATADAAGITAKLDQLLALIPLFGTNAVTVFGQTFKDPAPAGMPSRPDTSIAEMIYSQAYQASLQAAGIPLTVQPPADLAGPAAA